MLSLPTHGPLWWNPSWLRDALVYMGGSWDIPYMDSEPGKSKWLVRENPEEMLHVSELSYHKGETLSPPYVYPHVLHFFPPNKHFTCFTAFHPHENSFLQNWRTRAFSLTSGLMAKSWCPDPPNLTSVSSWELKPCFKPLQAEAIRDYPELCGEYGHLNNTRVLWTKRNKEITWINNK